MAIKKCELFKKEKGKVRCLACSHKCLIAEGKTGICGVRKNIGGELFLLVYGQVTGMHADPIEKKPLFHFLPGSKTFSFGTVGCNFKCDWCFHPSTSIFTNNGTINIKDLFEISQKGEHLPLVVTHTGELKKIKNVFEHKSRGPIIKIKPNYLPEIICTPYHEFFIKRNNNTEKNSNKKRGKR